MSDINTTPLVDVMLVLLIIFLITVPVVVQNIKLKLPEVRYDPTTTKPENVSLSIVMDEAGKCAVYWGMTRMGHQELYDRAKKKMKADIERLEGGGPDRPGEDPRGAYPRRRQHAVQVHRRGDLHDAERGLHQGRLHFAARRPSAARRRNRRSEFRSFESWQ